MKWYFYSDKVTWILLATGFVCIIYGAAIQDWFVVVLCALWAVPGTLREVSRHRRQDVRTCNERR